MLPLTMKTILEYLNEQGKSTFQKWFSKLDPQAAAKISTALYRLEQGNLSNVESVGEGVYENKLHFGPGYRIYFGEENKNIVILLYGGTKKGQSNDIALAKEYWKEYKLRRKTSIGDKKWH